MDLRTIECLRCGQAREIRGDGRPADAGECPSCGYLGWADRDSLSDALRRLIHERAPLAPRAHAVSSP